MPAATRRPTSTGWPPRGSGSTRLLRGAGGLFPPLRAAAPDRVVTRTGSASSGRARAERTGSASATVRRRSPRCSRACGGYATAVFGKWHLGHRILGSCPPRHGFRRILHQPVPALLERHVAETPDEQVVPRDLPLIEGETVIERNPDQSGADAGDTPSTPSMASSRGTRSGQFFLYLPHSICRTCRSIVSERFRDKSGRGMYGDDVLLEIDWSVGQVLAALKTTWTRRANAGDLHFRQWSVAVVRRPCRLGRTAPRGEGDVTFDGAVSASRSSQGGRAGSPPARSAMSRR